jgi:Spy/CpxP family protein refolding chaperone
MFSTVAVVFVFVFGITASYAQPMGPGMMDRGYVMGQEMNYGGWNQMSPEKQKEWERMKIAFWKDTLQLRQKLVNKQMELNTLWQEEDPDTDKAKDLSDEISDLQSRLLKRRNEFLVQCRKKFGDQGWSCPGAGYDVDPGRMGPGMMGREYGMGPGMMGRGYGMGPGMMHGGRGMGPGGMHRGRGMGPQYGRQYGPGSKGPQYQQPQKPMEEKNAKELLKDYLESTRNPNLKLGKIEDKGNNFEAEIQTKDGSLVDKILVDKRTGRMRSVY